MNNYLWKCFLQYFYNTTQGQNVLNFFHIFFPLTSKATLTCSFLRIQNRSFQFRINKLFKNIWFFMLDQCRQLYPFNPIRTGLLGGIKSREGGVQKTTPLKTLFWLSKCFETWFEYYLGYFLLFKISLADNLP